MPDRSALRAIYDDLWRGGRTALANGILDVDPLPVDGGPRWGISAVLRPAAWSDALVRCADDVARLAGSRTVVYGPSALHITVQQFEGHRTHVPVGDRSVRERSAVLAAVTRDLGPLEVELRGLTGSAGGVQLQGWPRFDLQALRLRLHRALEAAGAPVSGPETSPTSLRTSAHATLAIFDRSVDRPEELRACIEAHRETDFGTIAFDALWLVGYARTERSVTLVEYGRFPLDARAGSSR